MLATLDTFSLFQSEGESSGDVSVQIPDLLRKNLGRWLKIPNDESRTGQSENRTDVYPPDSPSNFNGKASNIKSCWRYFAALIERVWGLGIKV